MSITKEAIEKAAERIDSYIHHTPVMTNQSINEMFGINFYFKCENFQKIGAFKIRGGMNASLSLDANQLKNGAQILTSSKGRCSKGLWGRSDYL
jgi:threonine dehydratase